MKLIADSGATKTNWLFIQENNVVKQIDSPGISPYFMEEKAIGQILKEHVSLYINEVREIYYYGTGCDSEANKLKIKKALESQFIKTEKIEVASDLLAAARALCGNEKGIVCILGTGSNTCFFDGKNIKENIRGYGFILGDIGSGAALGKQLVHDFLFNQMPPHIKTEMATSFHASENKILEEVYRGKMPSRFLATYARFAHQHQNDPYMAGLLRQQFSRFFDLMVVPYSECISERVHFTGSVAFGFQELIREIAAGKGILIGKFMKQPMDGLLFFHTGFQG